MFARKTSCTVCIFEFPIGAVLAGVVKFRITCLWTFSRQNGLGGPWVLISSARHNFSAVATPLINYFRIAWVWLWFQAAEPAVPLKIILHEHYIVRRALFCEYGVTTSGCRSRMESIPGITTGRFYGFCESMGTNSNGHPSYLVLFLSYLSIILCQLCGEVMVSLERQVLGNASFYYPHYPHVGTSYRCINSLGFGLEI